MGDKKHTATFNADAYTRTADEMHRRRERVEDRGQQVLRETGRLDPLVDVLKGPRVSRNAFNRRSDGKYVLTNGPSLPDLKAFDTTGSMGSNIERAFEAIARLYMLYKPLGSRLNIQVASSVLQDVGDRYPVVQVTQFESDERSAEQLRLLLPARQGGDDPEDYDLGLLFVLRQVQTDWQQFYGLKGYLTIVADQVGRGSISPSVAREHLGIVLQSTLQTVDVCQQLLRSWQIFYVNVGSGSYRLDKEVSAWWSNMLGSGRVLEVPNRALNLLAEIQASLVWVGETAQPTQDGLVEFLLAGGQNRVIDRGDAEWVWDLLQPASAHFGAQTRLPNYLLLPKPGDVFVDLRDLWPEGHPNFGLNPSQQRAVSQPKVIPAPDSPDSGTGIDWNTYK